MKTQELASLGEYKNLSIASNLRASKLVSKDTKTSVKLFTLVTAATNLHKVVKKSELKEKDSVLSALVKIGNTVNGLIETAELSKEDAKKHIKKLQKRVATIESVVNAELKELYNEEVSAVTFEDMQKLTAAVHVDDQKEIEKILDANSATIKGLQHHAQKLPSTKDATKTFIVAKVPVIAVTPLTKENFKEGGFDVDIIGRYPVLNDQLVIGINPDTLGGVSMHKYAEMVVKGLENRTGTEYILMDNPKHYSNSGLMYYLLLPVKQANRTAKHAGRSFSIPKWGFAFK